MSAFECHVGELVDSQLVGQVAARIVGFDESFVLCEYGEAVLVLL